MRPKNGASPVGGAFFIAATTYGTAMAGRPTLYEPAFDDMVIEWGAQGKSVTWMAAQIGVARKTMYEWAAAHESFRDALDVARAKAQMWWEDAGQNSMFQPGFNASVWSKSMAARFPEDWRDNSRTELVGADGGPVQQSIAVEFVTK